MFVCVVSKHKKAKCRTIKAHNQVRMKYRVRDDDDDDNNNNNSARGMDVSLVSGVCCQVDVPATGRSLVQRSPTDCTVSLYVI